MPQPESQAYALVAEIEEWRAHGKQDAFGLKRFEREANKLLETNAKDAYMILGMIACLGNSPEAMRENHIKALNLAAGDQDPYINFAASLSMMGFPEESVRLMENGLAVGSMSRPATRVYVSCLIELGRYEEVLAYEHFVSTGPDGSMQPDGRDEIVLAVHLDLSKKMLELCDHEGLKPSDVGDALALLRRVLHQNGFYFHHLFQEVVGDEAGHWLRLIPEIPEVDEERLSSVEDDLVKQVVGERLPAFDSGLVVARML